MPGGLKKIAPLIIQPRGEYFYLGAVHILRQPPEGGGGVSQKLTIADEGGRGGKSNADHCWQRRVGSEKC